MSGGLRILIILTVMFVGIFFYSISYRYIKAAKKNKMHKEKFKKEEELKEHKLSLQKAREDKEKLVELRRNEIKQQFKWLDGMNQKIQNKKIQT